MQVYGREPNLYNRQTLQNFMGENLIYNITVKVYTHL